MSEKKATATAGDVGEQTCCAHLTVTYVRDYHDDGTVTGYWECRECRTRFCTIHERDKYRALQAKYYDELVQLRAELENVYAEVPCDKCNLPITPGCYGCSWLKAQAEVERLKARPLGDVEVAVEILRVENERLRGLLRTKGIDHADGT